MTPAPRPARPAIRCRVTACNEAVWRLGETADRSLGAVRQRPADLDGSAVSAAGRVAGHGATRAPGEPG